jgi:hypothetical protein
MHKYQDDSIGHGYCMARKVAKMHQKNLKMAYERVCGEKVGHCKPIRFG